MSRCGLDVTRWFHISGRIKDRGDIQYCIPVVLKLFGLQYPLFLVAESKFPPRGSILGYYMLLWGKLLQKIAARQAYNASQRDAL